MSYNNIGSLFEEPTAPKKKRSVPLLFKLIAAAIGLIIALIIAFNSFTRVEPGYAGVQYSLFGGLQDEVLPEGGHVHAPWINVYQYPISSETVALRNSKKGEDRADNSLQVNTSGGKSIAADVRYTYKFEANKLPDIFKRFRRQDAEWIADNYMKQILLDTIQAQTTKHSVLEVYAEKRSEITGDVFKTLRETLAEDGIVIEKFTITDVRLDDKTSKILQAVTDAENDKVRLQKEQEKLKEEAKNIAIQKENEKLQAEADKKIAVVNAQKEAEVQLIKATAEAEANKKKQSSLTKEIIQAQWIEKWNGSQPVVSGDSNSIVNLPESLLSPADKK